MIDQVENLYKIYENGENLFIGALAFYTIYRESDKDFLENVNLAFISTYKALQAYKIVYNNNKKNNEIIEKIFEVLDFLKILLKYRADSNFVLEKINNFEIKMLESVYQYNLNHMLKKMFYTNNAIESHANSFCKINSKMILRSNKNRFN